MNNRVSLWAIAAAAIALAATGCVRLNPRSANARPTTAQLDPAEPEISQLSAAELERRIESSAHFATAIIYDLREQPAKALEEYCEAAQENLDYEPLTLEAARRLIRAHKAARALQLLKLSSARPDASATIFAWLGIAYAQAGQREKAVAANLAAIKKSPVVLPAYQNLAQLYAQQGKTNLVWATLDAAARQQNVSAEFLVDLAETYDRFGRLQVFDPATVKPAALKALRKAADLNPRNPGTLLKLGDGLLLLGDPVRAEKAYLALEQIDPDTPSIHEKLADAYLRSGQKEAAERELETILRDNPANAQLYLSLAALALDDKKYQTAAEYLEKAILFIPEYEPAYLQLAILKLTLRQPKQAIEWLDRARAKFKPSFDLEYWSGLAESVSKNYAQALRRFTSAEILAKAGETNKLKPDFYFQFGSAYERSGDLRSAEEEFRAALRLAPNFAEALNYLGYMWADRGTRLEEAKELIERALKVEPDNPAYLDSLGWVLYKLKRPQQALAFLLKAVQKSPEPDPTLYDHLGDIYAALQQYGPARDAWEKSLRIEPNEQIQAIKKKLESVPKTAQSGR